MTPGAVPLSAKEVFANARGFNWVRRHGDGLLWTEGRPSEGRSVLVRWQPDGTMTDVNPDDTSCSNAVTYGGIPFGITDDGDILFCVGGDQRVYRLSTGEAVTPASDDKRMRWSDLVVHGDQVYAVREWHHEDGWIDNEIVRFTLGDLESAVTLVSGFEFVGAPRISPDGTQLAWVGWNPPQMPWDGTELWVAQITADGVADAVRVAGSTEESVQEPSWTASGDLVYMSDRSGYWNLYQQVSGADDIALVSIDADMSEPYWSLGLKTYDFFDDGRILVRWTTFGTEHIGIRHLDGRLEEIVTPYTRFLSPTVIGERIAVIAAGPRHLARVTLLDVAVGGEGQVLRDNGLTAPEVISVPVPIAYPTTGGATAYAFYYAPTVATDGLLPLVVNSHGGPTGHVPPILDLKQQYWTSRGYAYLELNFRGSSGHGRAYRNALRGQWGIVDIDDAVAGAQHLVEQGIVDPRKMVVRGLSGGGWLTLCCMAFHDVFAAGASMNGVADARGFSAQTHKFEAHYLETLIGPEAEVPELYAERSPVTAAAQITKPLMLLQGDVDDVVPRNQADAIAEVMTAHGLEHVYHLYEGEGHLFAKEENLVHALEAETDFFANVLARVDA